MTPPIADARTPARHLFIGDIQGCREELERLLERLNFDPAADALHPVGDFVNRGPDSLGTLRLLRSLDAGGVLGNHDVHLLRVAAGTRKPGKRDTLEALLASDDRDELLAWLAQRPFARAFDGWWLVHAGLHPAWKDPAAALAGLDPLTPAPAIAFATRARYCDPDGNLPSADWPEPERPFRPWYEHLPGARSDGRGVVYGHWARAGLIQRVGLRGLDTGCVWGGKLTAWSPEEDRVVQVDAARTYASYE